MQASEQEQTTLPLSKREEKSGVCARWVVFFSFLHWQDQRETALWKSLIWICLSPTQKLRTAHRWKINRKTDVGKNPIDAAGSSAGNITSILSFRLLNLVSCGLYISNKYIVKIEEIEKQTRKNQLREIERVWERLTGSPGSLPPRILKPNPVSFLHRKMSCSWKSGTAKSTNHH